ncbi:rubrerythrin family protein [Serpentinicella sp. ANB-PHB4]|uniref:rubrerythrin family protein n=1 Tax=Serpentinicella sp. ANB-PHB4 TaxID=3074076 RepID=UPI00286444ED|nr:rubrerythrin family protein [Serpentinicella sp. ANB-PHB4]MDR5658621.1 rubrerythrin family protein [Serpentinicella sp. ANB-PHB4]
MNLKGTQTEKNLWLAFSGESQARNKYAFFADFARKEGYDEIAKVFEQNANQEKEHARLIFDFLHNQKSTKENLKIAAQGENYEAFTMYKEYERVARSEGFEEIAKFFEEIGKIEAEHEKKYLALLQSFTEK